ncbi:unnamed protein product [Caenorhabditis bovis]|uniref:Uncharacterized protein n=1 Tax=Caenorhabditis bovis TaxID=2654633 RepID=A0A8S1EAG3_9PELO|nr:unnamed protein product [Caenorhabditis bovis]
MLLMFSSAHCYSCASTNMKSNFITKQRGPPNRIGEPLVFDDNCNSDTWIIKDRSKDDCGDGFCFKWQQSLNNSGVYSTMTFRGCYSKLYSLQDPNTFRPPNHSYCTVANVPLSCLSDASVIEHSCWCQGDFCNATFIPISHYLIVLLVLISAYSWQA